MRSEKSMSKRRRLARERLEIYLVHLILAYRRLIFLSGLFLLVYAIAIMFTSLLAGNAFLLPAIFLLVLSNSFNAVLYTVRAGAWIATLWRNDD